MVKENFIYVGIDLHKETHTAVFMDKDSVLNINLQPIADVTNNLIEKLASGIGWLATLIIFSANKKVNAYFVKYFNN